MTEIDGGREARAVQELYRGHEQLVDGAGERLMPAVRVRLRRHRVARRAGYAAVAFAVVAVLGTAVTVAALDHPARPGPAGGPVPARGSVAVPAGSRIESSLGAEITVPVDWRLNDTGCHQDARPTVVRGGGSVLLCYTPTPADKDYVFIEPTGATPPSYTIGDDSASLPSHAVTVDGVPATRAEGRLAGGQYAGWVIVAPRHLQIFGRTNDKAMLTTILDSLRLVDVDNVGCPTDQPSGRPARSDLTTVVDPDPVSVSVCWYDRMPVLQASAGHTGAAALAIAAAVNHTPPGNNPPPPADCTPDTGPVGYDAVMFVHSADGKVREVTLNFQPCVPKQLDNGGAVHQVPVGILPTIMDGLYVGYGYVP